MAGAVANSEGIQKMKERGATETSQTNFRTSHREVSPWLRTKGGFCGLLYKPFARSLSLFGFHCIGSQVAKDLTRLLRIVARSAPEGYLRYGFRSGVRHQSVTQTISSSRRAHRGPYPAGDLPLKENRPGSQNDGAIKISSLRS